MESLCERRNAAIARQSQSLKDFHLEAAKRYAASLPGSPAAEYLESRGLQQEMVTPFSLGYVSEPLPGHEMYEGMLAIPYLRFMQPGEASVVSIRYRCVQDHDCRKESHGKYNTMPGDTSRLYNTLALIEAEDEIVITEGELDVVAADALCGLYAVGVPGAQAWKPHFVEPFLGYDVVWILADGDDPGLQFAKKVASDLPNARILPCPPGEDVNSLVLKEGPEAITSRMSD